MEIRATRTDALLDDDDPSLERATSLLGIDKSEFKRWILKKQIVTRTDKIVTSLNAAQANVVKDSVAKHIYASLFEWLVAVINESLTNEKVEGTVKNFIGVLVSPGRAVTARAIDGASADFCKASSSHRTSMGSSTSRRTRSSSSASTMRTRNSSKRCAARLKRPRSPR